MKIEINPKESPRAEAFELWMTSPMPMVTLTKRFDVSRVVRLSKRHGRKFNALLCWCIAKAASQMEQFYTILQEATFTLLSRGLSQRIVLLDKLTDTLRKSYIARVYATLAICYDYIHRKPIVAI